MFLLQGRSGTIRPTISKSPAESAADKNRRIEDMKKSIVVAVIAAFVVAELLL